MWNFWLKRWRWSTVLRKQRVPEDQHRQVKFPLSFIYCFKYVLLFGGIYYRVCLFQLSVSDDALTESEIENVSWEAKDNMPLLAEEMDTEYSPEEAKRPTQDLAYSLIADFAESKDGTRNKLVQFLRSANFPDTARR